MEERKRGYAAHWTTPDVFCGEIQHAVGQSNYVKRLFEAEPTNPTAELLDTKVETLQTEINDMHFLLSQMKELVERQQAKIDSLTEFIRELEAHQAKERSHLYQVVLSLKQEWETLK